MAGTAFHSSLAVSRWSSTLLREAEKQIYFKPFMGKNRDPNAIIHNVDDLNHKRGKDITFGLIMLLSGDGTQDNQVMEGNEEAMDTYPQTVTLGRRRNAVRDEGEFEDQKFMINFRREARGKLAIWLAEIIDQDIFTALSASPTRSLADDSGGFASFEFNIADPKANLDADDVVSSAGISALKRLAKVPIGSDEVKIRPVKIKGRSYWVLILHPDSAYDWKQSSTWTQAQREAQLRGGENPIFSGALGIWDGVVIHEHEDVTTFDDGGGAAVHGAINLFLGAQSVVFARNKKPKWVEKKFDYDDKVGIAVALIYGYAKTLFNSEDFATIAYYTGASAFAAS